MTAFNSKEGLEQWMPLIIDLLVLLSFQLLFNDFIEPSLVDRFAAQYPSNFLIIFVSYLLFLLSVYFLLQLERDVGNRIAIWSRGVLKALSFLFPCGVILGMLSSYDADKHPNDFFSRILSVPAPEGFIGDMLITALGFLLVVVLLILFLAFFLMMQLCEGNKIAHGTWRYLRVSSLANIGVSFMVVISTAFTRAYFLGAAAEEGPINMRQKIFYASLLFFLIMPFMVAPARLVMVMTQPRVEFFISSMVGMIYFSWKIVS